MRHVLQRWLDRALPATSLRQLGNAWLRLLAALAASAAAPALPQPAPGEVSVFAAGSLRAALTEVATAWHAVQPNARVKLTFGASGLLKDRLLRGEAADVFASANLEHPQALADAGRAAPPRAFARNLLCALVAPDVALAPDTLIQRLLDPKLRVATSTPKSDPAGDYAFAMFERIEQSGRAGASKTLSEKALQLTGGPNSPAPPANRNVHGALMQAGKADVFITYCTNAVVAIAEVPALRSVVVPASVNVGASYGVTVLRAPGGVAQDTGDAAQRFVDFLLGAAGQAVLARHGFLSH